MHTLRGPIARNTQAGILGAGLKFPPMTLLLTIPLFLSPIASVAPTQTDWPLTRAERSNYGETSTYDDVVQFVHALQQQGAPLRIIYIGKSTEGRPIPMVVCSNPLVANPLEAKRSGKPIVYIQANIHAGEVEGKEAAQQLLRDYCRDHNKVLDKLVLIVNPIYNADGNEKFGPMSRNRPGQNGPESVGVRPNGQGLDLNRDCVKAESPEMQAALDSIYTKWDPDVIMDLHTTDGVRHGYDLTYSPPTNPNCDPGVLRYSRDLLLPAVRTEMRNKHKWEFFDYIGDLQFQGKQAWCTFGSEARYVSNYAGFRNRIGILSEAVVYLPFKDRVNTTYEFVDSVLNKIAKDAATVVRLTKQADENATKMANAAGKSELGVRFDLESRGDEFVLLEKRPAAGATRPSGRPTEIERVKMPVMDRFKSTRMAKYPCAYIIPATETKTIELLLKHGIVVERFRTEVNFGVDEFIVGEFFQAPTPFQNHKLIRLEGKFERTKHTVEPGDFIVSCAQPMGPLAFHLLEAESVDGAMAWGFLGEKFEVGSKFPIRKTYQWPNVPTEVVRSVPN